MPATTRDRGVLNFYAGPTALPWPVIERMREDIVDFHGTRMGVMEISHRAPEIEGLIADTAARVRRLLGLNADYEVLFLQGGGSLQFSERHIQPVLEGRRCTVLCGDADG